MKLTPVLTLLLISSCALTVLCTLPAPAQTDTPAQQHRPAKPSPETPVERLKLESLKRTLLAAARPRLAQQKAESPPDIVTAARIQQDTYYVRSGVVSWSVTTEIKKTDSPTASYVGLVTRTMETKKTPKYMYETRAEAEQAPLTKIVDFDEILTFTYQNGKWIYKGRQKGHARPR